MIDNYPELKIDDKLTLKIIRRPHVLAAGGVVVYFMKYTQNGKILVNLDPPKSTGRKDRTFEIALFDVQEIVSAETQKQIYYDDGSTNI